VALNVTADWLLFGVGPMGRDQVNEATSLEAAFAGMLRREVTDRLHGKAGQRIGADDIDFDYRRLVESILSEASSRIQSRAEQAISGAERYRKDMERLTRSRGLSQTFMALDIGQSAASAQWEANRDEREKEERHLQRRHLDVPEDVKQAVRLSRKAVRRLQNSPLNELQSLFTGSRIDTPSAEASPIQGDRRVRPKRQR
jgi:hypothetical protein